MNIIRAENLEYSYGSELILKYPNITCGPGEQLLILGDSGSGKSTLLHLLGLILPFKKGVVAINGTEVQNLSAKSSSRFRAEHIGLVFQQHHFVKSLNVKDNLFLANYYAKKMPDKEGLESIAKRLEITSLLKKSIFKLSGGEMQRVGIARALMNKPKVILADEPTSNLDDKNCENVFSLLRESSNEMGAALIIVTHDQRLKEKVKTQIQL
ncbi:MAG: ABC-type lipoprotein export system ATPase subunit [Psychromonas sp.]|jgi:ABC-type lipoprotein export system ATPase subunit